MTTRKNSLFKRLQISSPLPKKSAKEDFFMEALVYVLLSEKDLLIEYVKFLLKKFDDHKISKWKKDKVNPKEIAKITDFVIETQVEFTLLEEKDVVGSAVPVPTIW